MKKNAGKTYDNFSGLTLVAKKSLGQHFLKDPKIVSKIVGEAHIESGENVLEIGPGEGIVTTDLITRGARVIAVEKDIRAIDALREKFKKSLETGQLRLIQADILEIDIFSVTDLGQEDPYKVVANIPYYITGAILEHIFSAKQLPQSVVLLVQRGVAERVTQKKNSILSLSINVYGATRMGPIVKKGSFVPAPKVDSAVLVIRNISRDFFVRHHISEKSFFNAIKAGFSHKRKKLLSNLQPLAPNTTLKSLWKSLEISENVRAEDIDLELWGNIARGIQK